MHLILMSSYIHMVTEIFIVFIQGVLYSWMKEFCNLHKDSASFVFMTEPPSFFTFLHTKMTLQTKSDTGTL